MSEQNSVVPFNEILDSKIDVNLAIEQAKKMTAVLDSMGIEKATFKTGAMFHRDPKTNTATLATDALMVQQRAHTTTVTIRNTGSSEQQALEELRNHVPTTQELLGSFSGKSQPWVSNQRTSIESE